MTILELLLFSCIAVASVVLGTVVLIKDPRSIVNNSFAMFLLGIAVTLLGFISLKLHFPFELFDKLIFYGGLFTLLGLFVFSQVFPSRTAIPTSRWPLYIPFAIVAVLIPFNLIIERASFSTKGLVMPMNGPLFVPHMIFWILYFILSMYFLVETYKKTDSLARQQLQYLFTGIVTFLSCLLFFSVILPSIGITSLYNIGPISSLVLIWLTTMAIIKHHLMDIRLVIQRGLIYVVLVALTIGLYVIGLQFLGYLLQKATDVTSVISAGIITLLGIFFIEPLRRYLEKVTDPIFFKGKYIYSDALKKLSRMLNTSMSQGDVIETSTTALKEIFKTKDVRFSLGEEGGEITTPTAVVTMPIIFEEQRIGTITLGEKQSRDPYTYQDMQLLETFLHQAAVALEKGRLYNQVQEYTSHLEQIVEERTSEIKKIQQEQKQAMIDISHNLQTPLAVIRNELELMTEYSSDPGKMITARRSLMRISEFIRQLLHLARLDGSVYDITFSELNLSQLVEEQVEYFEVMGVEQQLKVTADIEKGVIIEGNKRLLGEALTNLAQNAIKYRRSDIESTLHITLANHPNFIELTVEDNGIGISSKDQKDIFTRFYRTSRASEMARGVGLGLAIVSKIVEMHSGTISVRSAVNKGTCFTIRLNR